MREPSSSSPAPRCLPTRRGNGPPWPSSVAPCRVRSRHREGRSAEGAVGDADGVRQERRGVAMMGEQTSARASEVELLRHAVALLQSRHERGSGYEDLSPTAVAELSNTLEAVATAEDDLEGGDRQGGGAPAPCPGGGGHPQPS